MTVCVFPTTPTKKASRTSSIIAGAVVSALAAFSASADLRDDVGYTYLVDHHLLKSDGAGIKIAQVESSNNSGSYAPDSTSNDFSGKTIDNLSGSAAYSAHATMVGNQIYGRTDGLAPGVTRISAVSEEDFVTSLSLRTGNVAQAPQSLAVSVINNSWIGEFDTDELNYDAVRRLDYAIARDNVVVVSAVNNGAGTTIPSLLAPAYNGIAVGAIDSNNVVLSSSGTFTFDGVAGRSKPDIVAPAANTSNATGAVSGAAALLIAESRARSLPTNAQAIKAILMAAADRGGGWQRGASGSGDDGAAPLDFAQGAGNLRLDNAHRVLSLGQQKPNNPVARIGWDTRAISDPDYGVKYTFTTKTDIPQFSAVLTWRRKIKGMVNGVFDLTSTLTDMKLVLNRKAGSKWNRVFKSDSKVDNVETITLDDLQTGTYQLIVFGSAPDSYALAWYSNSRASVNTLPPIPGNGGPKQGFAAAYGRGTDDVRALSASLSSQSVPEPATLGVLAAGMICLASRRRRR